MADEKITMHRVTDDPPGRCASCATSVGRWVDADRVEIKAHLVCSSCLAALAEAQRERDEERRKVEALLLGDKALQPRIWLGEEVQRLKAERDDARRLADLTAEQVAANAQILDEERALRRAAEAAVGRVRAELAFFGQVAEDADAPASKREGLRRWVDLIYAALDDDPAAVDTYETQEGTE